MKRLILAAVAAAALSAPAMAANCAKDYKDFLGAVSTAQRYAKMSAEQIAGSELHGVARLLMPAPPVTSVSRAGELLQEVDSAGAKREGIRHLQGRRVSGPAGSPNAKSKRLPTVDIPAGATASWRPQLGGRSVGVRSSVRASSVIRTCRTCATRYPPLASAPSALRRLACRVGAGRRYFAPCRPSLAQDAERARAAPS